MSRWTRLIRQVLADSGHDYEIIEIDPELADTAQFCEAYGYPMEQSANTIVCVTKRGPEQFAACVVLATDRLDVNGTVKRELGASKASFADADRTRELTGMEIGGVTALALPHDLPLWIDAAVMDCDWIILGAGDRGHKINVTPRILTDLPNARVVEGLAKQ